MERQLAFWLTCFTELSVTESVTKSVTYASVETTAEGSGRPVRAGLWPENPRRAPLTASGLRHCPC